MLWYYKLLAHRPHLILVFVGILCVACIVVSLTTRRFPDFTDPTLGFEARGTKLGQRMTAWHNLLDETRASDGLLNANPYEYYDEYDDEAFEDSFRSSGMKKKKKRPGKQRHNKKRKKVKLNKGSLVLTEKIQLIKNASSQVGQDRSRTSGGGGGGGSAVSNVLPGTTTGGGDDEEDSDERWEYGKNVSFFDDEDLANNRRVNWTRLTKENPPPFDTDIHTSNDGFFCESPSE